jgi:hypothetical protein
VRRRAEPRPLTLFAQARDAARSQQASNLRVRAREDGELPIVACGPQRVGQRADDEQ